MNEANPFPYEGPPQLLPAIRTALERVVDPEVALDIVSIGLVYGVRVTDGPDKGRVDVNVTMTTAACPVASLIVADIENELDRALPQDLLIHVEVVWEPPWTPERMNGRARAFMGW
jgi:metal-sulfur cluster biosynthetic enzyme